MARDLSHPSWALESKPFLEFIKAAPRTPSEISEFASLNNIPRILVPNTISWLEINGKIFYHQDKWCYGRE